MPITFVKGIFVGIILSLPVGPVGVLSVRRTLFEGISFGLVSGLGAACADTLFGLIAGFGLTFVRDAILAYRDWLGEAGGLCLVYLGGRAIFMRRPPEPEPLAGEALLGTFASAFALTVANPFAILWIAAIFAKIGLDPHATMGGVAVVVLGIFTGSAAWWLGLCIGVSAIRRYARALLLRAINLTSGGLLLASGLGLLVAASLGLAGMRR